MVEILKIREVVQRTRRGICSVYMDGRTGLFPEAIKLGRKSSGWLKHEVDAWMEARIAGKSDDEVKSEYGTL